MDKSNKCGLLCWHPECLQSYAKTKYFVIIYGLLGTVQAMSFMYFLVTLTTLEKRFKIPSQTTGIVLSGNEISQILLSLILSYAGGQRNRPRWIAWGMVFCAMSCFVLTLLHIIFGPGEEALQLTQEYLDSLPSINKSIVFNSSTSFKGPQNVCDGNDRYNDQCEEIVSQVPSFLIFLSQFFLGIGNTLYFALGQTYLDDNTKKTNTPLMLGFAMSLRMIGPIFGFLLGAASLSIYIDPQLTPIIDQKNPKWLGAWWFGWMILGTIMLLLSGVIGLFPKQLPKKREIKNFNSELPKVLKSNPAPNDEYSLGSSFPSTNALDKSVVTSTVDFPKLEDFPKALMRLLKNKLLIFNIFSAIFYTLGVSGFMTFLTKYMEVQFFKNAQNATILVGPSTLCGMVSAYLASGFVISKKKPKPSKLLFWNVIIGIFYVIGQFCYLFLYCSNDSNTFLNERGSLKNLTNVCNVDCGCNGISYDPVCHTESYRAFYSPCHAGCQSWNSDEKIFMNCTCVANKIEDLLNSSVIIDSLDFENKRPTSNFEEWSDSTPSISSLKPLKINIEFVKPGVCEDGCALSYYLFVVVTVLVQSFGASGRIGNTLVNYRSVSTQDKSFAQGLALTSLSLLALIPGPIIFGRLIDKACLVWSDKCGVSGNCQLYDQQLFRYFINLTAMALTLIGVFFDFLVWCYGRELDLYGENAKHRLELLKTKNRVVSPLLDRRHENN